ncbi:FxDxF family PEP-CTERM protein [Pseudothauera lacus]|uniref:FxDxF family PEP-CTERM protein n=1 Tax=Pseudothauera lacus TaxID=2136175 RepID=UPI0015E72300|nr:FxDxF family PEP-CTERM protein [Pseudothauera lacus]
MKKLLISAAIAAAGTANAAEYSDAYAYSAPEVYEDRVTHHGSGTITSNWEGISVEVRNNPASEGISLSGRIAAPHGFSGEMGYGGLTSFSDTLQAEHSAASTLMELNFHVAFDSQVLSAPTDGGFTRYWNWFNLSSTSASGSTTLFDYRYNYTWDAITSSSPSFDEPLSGAEIIESRSSSTDQGIDFSAVISVPSNLALDLVFYSAVESGCWSECELTFSTLTPLTIGLTLLDGTLSSANGYSYLAAPVPEPGTYAMLLAGLGVIGAVARRRKRAA